MNCNVYICQSYTRSLLLYLSRAAMKCQHIWIDEFCDLWHIKICDPIVIPLIFIHTFKFVICDKFFHSSSTQMKQKHHF
jgi:hypothetical protein